MKAPAACPKSSLSIRASGKAPQSTVTKGPPARGEAAWAQRARALLPVPDSPKSKSVIGVWAAAPSFRSKVCMASLLATSSGP